MLIQLFAVVVPAIAITTSVLLASSQSLGANDPGRAGTAVAKGECSRLITGADDYTAKCDPQAASVTLVDGTIVFVFTIEGTPVGFSGDGKLVAPAFDGAMKLPVNFIAIGENARLGAFEARDRVSLATRTLEPPTFGASRSLRRVLSSRYSKPTDRRQLK